MQRRVWFVIIGDAASRLQGAPLAVNRVEIVLEARELNVRKFSSVMPSPPPNLQVAVCLPPDADVWREAEELPWLPTPRMRVLNRWIDVPSGFVASLEYLAETADGERRALLEAVLRETDEMYPGFRIYRDPERAMLRMPRPRRVWSRRQRERGPLSRID